MAKILCNQRVEFIGSNGRRVPMSGGTLVSPTLIKYEQCDKYLTALTKAGLLRPRTLMVPIETQNEQVAKELYRVTKSTGYPVNFNPKLIGAILDDYSSKYNLNTKTSTATESTMCRSFNKTRDSMSGFIFNHDSSVAKAVKNGARIMSQREDGIYWAALFDALRDANMSPDYTSYLFNNKKPIPASTEVNVNKYNPNAELDELKAKIRFASNAFNKVNSLIQKTLDEINSLRAQNRILPAKSQVLDNKGVPTGEERVVFLEVPSGIDLKKVQGLPPAERAAAISRISNESKPLRNPFDIERLQAGNVTQDEFNAYREVSERLNELNADPTILGSLNTTTDSIVKLNLSKKTTNQILRFNRIVSGQATINDYLDIQSGDFSESIKRLSESPELDDLVVNIAKKGGGLIRSAFVGEKGGFWDLRPTTGIVIAEGGTKALGNTIASSMEAELRRATTINELNRTTTVTLLSEPVQETATVGARTVNRSFVNSQANQIINTRVKKIAETSTELSHKLPYLGVAYYGVQTIGAGFNFASYLVSGDSKNAQKYFAKTTKYGALTGLELLCAFHLVTGFTTPIILSFAIYEIWDFAEKSAEADKRKKEEQTRRAVAIKANLVPSAYAYNIVIRNESLLQAVSEANDDPNDDLEIKRNGTPSVQKITVTYPYIYTGPQAGRTGAETRTRTVTELVPIIPINIVDKQSITISPDGTTKPLPLSEKQEELDRCTCCGPCNGEGILIEYNNTPISVLSPECISTFKKWGQQYLTTWELQGISGGDDLVKLGIDRLCKFKGSCFTSDVKVLTPNGEINIDKINVGDSVIAFDMDSNLIESTVIETFIHKESLFYEYTFDNYIKIQSTPNHPFYTNNGFIEIGKLNIGDSVIHKDGHEIKLTSVEKKYNTNVYNIEVDEYHTYIANNIRVHNKFNPDSAFQARQNLPPISQQKHKVLGNWSEPSDNETWDIGTARWNFQTVCDRVRKSNANPNPIDSGDMDYTKPLSEVGPRADPLTPAPSEYNWICRMVPFRTFMPGINEGPFGNDGFGYSREDLMNGGGFTVPPLQDTSTFKFPGPPYQYISQPSSPYFPWQESNISPYLSGFPYYLNENEINLVKGGNLEEVKKYFETIGKDPNDPSNLKAYHLTLISWRYTENKEISERNMDERKRYMDCINTVIKS